MIIINSVGLYILILVIGLCVISLLNNLNIKIMLWIFLITFNLLFIICLWDYFQTNFYYIFYYVENSLYLNLNILLHKYHLYVSYNILIIFYWKLVNLIHWSIFFNIFSNNWPALFNSCIVITLCLITINGLYILYNLNYILLTALNGFLNRLFSCNTILNWEGFLNYTSADWYSLTHLTTIQHLFVLLTIFITPFALFSNWNDLKFKILSIKHFLILLIILDLLLIICFSTFNLFLFILVFESTTLPLFLLISLFGHRSKKFRAAWYLFIYTLVGSVFMLGSVILIYYQFKTINLLEIFYNYQFINISSERLKLIWLGLFLGFAIKVPIAPFHMWLPEAHVEAPTAGSILLAGILLKLGGFGMIFFLLPFFNNNFFLPLVYTLSIVSMLYSSLILFRETHFKKIIAYSSIVHMNISILGLFSNNAIGIVGGIFMMFSHGFISSGLFYSGGILFNRFKSYDISTIKNLSSSMPKFSFFLILLIFGNMGLPLTSGFIGEFLVLIGIIHHNYFILIIVLLILLVNTVYNIILMSRVLYGNILLPSFLNKFLINNKILYNINWKLISNTQDISRLEFFSLINLTFYSIFFGIFPNFFLISFWKDYYLFLI